MFNDNFKEDFNKLGIVLTPKHIIELMCSLSKLSSDSVVLDPCTGTGRFLIVARESTTNLIGIEIREDLYAIASDKLNTTIYLGSCFDPEISKDIKENKRPNVALINPPYSQKGKGLSELDFIKHTLDLLQPNGVCVAIVPMSCGIKPSQVKKDLLASHTLEACLSMNSELFYRVGTHTIVLVFRAHVPHDENKPTYIADWSDDGLVSVKNQGRQDVNNLWPARKKQFLDDYFAKREVKGISVVKNLSVDDEWVIQAHLETDYSKLTKKDFQRVLLERMLYELGYTNMLDYVLDKVELPDIDFSGKLVDEPLPELNPGEWKEFKLSDLFDFERGKVSKIPKDDLDNNGAVNFLTCSSKNNGCIGRIDIKAQANNCLSIANNGVHLGTAFYQDGPVTGTADVCIAKPKFEISKNIGLFISVIIHQEKPKYSYGRKFGLDKMRDTMIKLPSTPQGEPNWEWMEEYMDKLSTTISKW